MTTLAASEAQRQKVAGASCVVCWRAPCDPAHLIDRSIRPDPRGEPLRVIPLCRQHHEDYDNGRLDLLPYWPQFGPEQAYAVRLVGLITAIERISNQKWGPVT